MSNVSFLKIITHKRSRDHHRFRRITVRTASFVRDKHMGKFSAPMEYKLMGNFILDVGSLFADEVLDFVSQREIQNTIVCAIPELLRVTKYTGTSRPT